MKKGELALLIIAAVIGAVLLINLAGGSSYNLNAFEIELEAHISSQKGTQINFPPVGKLIVDTHSLPLHLQLTVLNINPEQLNSLLEQVEDQEQLINDLQLQSRSIVQAFLLRSLLIAFLGGLLGAYIIGFRKKRKVFLAGFIAVILLLTLLAGTYYSYDTQAFNDPNYQGMLAAAPWAVGLIEEGLNNIDQLGQEMEQIVSNISNLFLEVESLRSLEESTGGVKVLHVSDIHNNPVAFDFIGRVTENFEVDFIIDTGDISDYGTPMEAKLATRIEELELPYLFVPGNHDSPSIIEEMSNLENVTVLIEDIVEIKGLTIAGMADPAAKGNQMKIPDSKVFANYQQRLRELVFSAPQLPDIVAVHNFYDLAVVLIGEVPLILHGHNHTVQIREEAETNIVNAGTTGASGIRGLQSRDGDPYTLTLLHFDNQEQPQLRTVDIIKIHSREGGFILERKAINTPRFEMEEIEE